MEKQFCHTSTWIVSASTCMNVFSWFLTSSGQLSKSLRSLVTLVLICLTSPVNASTVNLSNSDNHLHVTEKIQYVWIAKLTLDKKNILMNHCMSQWELSSLDINYCSLSHIIISTHLEALERSGESSSTKASASLFSFSASPTR